MEGQATWLTWAYDAKLAGGKAEVPARLIEQLTQEDGQPPTFRSSPGAALLARVADLPL